MSYEPKISEPRNEVYGFTRKYEKSSLLINSMKNVPQFLFKRDETFG